MGTIVEKVEENKRGYGFVSMAIFRNPDAPEQQHGWDYVEVTYPDTNGYQSGVRSLTERDAQSLLGKRVNEIKDMGFRILKNKFHFPEISEKGNITSLLC